MDHQHSFNETVGQASLYIEILVITFYSTLAKTTLLGRIKLAEEIGTKSSNSKVVHISIYDSFLLSFIYFSDMVS